MKIEVRIGNKYWFDYESRFGSQWDGDIDVVKHNKVFTHLALTPKGLDELISDASYVATEHLEYLPDVAHAAGRALVHLEKAKAQLDPPDDEEDRIAAALSAYVSQPL